MLTLLSKLPHQSYLKSNNGGCFSPLAQMEERQILILDVAGSNPAGVATLKKVSRYLKCELEIKGDICQKLQISK